MEQVGTPGRPSPVLSPWLLYWLVWVHGSRIPKVSSPFGQLSACKALYSAIDFFEDLLELIDRNRKIPTMLADHVEKNNLQGKLKYSLFVGASSGAETENRWADLDMIERRAPHQVGKAIAKGINEGRINFFDKHLSMFPVCFRSKTCILY